MSRSKSWPARVARSLSAHLDRLRDTLNRLRGQLREAVTEALGGSAAAAAKDAVRAALLDNAFPSAGDGRSYRSSSSTWDDPWNEREADYRSAYWKRESYGDADPYEPEEQPDEPLVAPAAADKGVRRWGLALATGCQTAAWWLRRQTGRYTMLTALGVGLASAAASYVAGPVILAGAGLAESALSLTAMSAAARAGCGALSGFGAR